MRLEPSFFGVNDRTPNARVTFRVCQCIHPEFDHMGTLVVQVKILENGVCTAVVEAAVSIGSTVVIETPNDRGC